jgi:GNAT superfamily N-acetyltransferase
MKIRAASSADDAQIVRLIDAYVAEANPRLMELTGRTIVPTDIHEVRRWVAASHDEGATILLAEDSELSFGTGTLRQHEPAVAEIKRLYVEPTHRHLGVGAVLDGLLNEGRRRGVRLVRLDSAPFQQRAHALYRSRGFIPCAPYPGSETPPEVNAAWHFFERALS